MTDTGDPFGGVYRGMPVMITGNTGFKGSWLALWLSELGANVIGFSLDDHGENSHFRVAGLAHETVFADVRNKPLVVDTFARCQPRVVFHLAAQALVRSSFLEPSLTYETYVIGTLNVMEAARQCGSVEAIVNVTTDKVYENAETGRPYEEDDQLGGYDPYSSSKACAEILTASYRRSFADAMGMQIATARAGNVIGGGDWADDRLVPDLVRAARSDEVTAIRSPRSTRPWQHVLDPVSGYLLLGRKLLEEGPRFASAWNFGPANSANIPVRELVHRMQSRWAKIRYVVDEADAAQHHEATYLMLNCRKSKQQLGWEPTWDIAETVERTSDWYRAYCDSGRFISEEQLRQYVTDARAAGQAWC